MGTEMSKQDILSTSASGASAIGMYYGAKKVLSNPLKKYKNTCIFGVISNNDKFKEPAINALKSENIKFKHVDSIFDFMFDDYILKEIANKNRGVTDKISSTIKKLGENIIPKKLQNEDKMFEKLEEFAAGENACAIKEKVFVNFDKMSMASFHEMGHTKNYKDFGGKILQKMRNPLFTKGLFGLALGSAILISDKNKDERVNIENNSSPIDKGKMFLKDNCVTLAALSQAPILAEEGLASIKGAAIGKKYLSSQNLSKLNRFNLKAWGSYLIGAAIMVGVVFAADKTKNALA